MRKTLVIIIISAAVGYSFGFLHPSATKDGHDDAPIDEPRQPGTTENSLPYFQAVSGPETDSAASSEHAQKQTDDGWIEINRLTAELDNERARSSNYASRVEQLQVQLDEAGNAESRRESWRDRIARLKQEDPARYEEIQKQRLEFQSRMEQSIADKSAFLINLDVSSMADEEQKVHAELQARIAKAWSAMKTMEETEPSREQITELRENYMAIRRLYGQERKIVLRQLGVSMGLEKKEAEQFGDYIQEIYEKTSPHFPGMRWSRGRNGQTVEQQQEERTLPVK